MKINYSNDVAVELKDNVFSVFNNGQEYKFDVTFIGFPEDGGINVESLTYEKGVFIHFNKQCTQIIGSGKHDEVYVDNEGITSINRGGKVFFMEQDKNKMVLCLT